MTETELILTRKPGQSIRVDGPCTFTVKAINGNRVKVGCSAEQHVGIVRTELDNDDTVLTGDGE